MTCFTEEGAGGGYGKKANMFKSQKLQVDNLVYIYISVTVT